MESEKDGVRKFLATLPAPCGSGVIEGVTESTLVPQGNATRAQAATMLMRFIEKMT